MPGRCTGTASRRIKQCSEEALDAEEGSLYSALMFLVPGLSASDPAAFLAVIAVLTGVALLATLAPAVRALRVDPMTALRYE